jgi:hypothetical protein
VSPRYVDNDLVDGAAFQLRASDNGELSVNLIGDDPVAFDERLVEVRHLSRLNRKRNGRFAQITAADIRGALTDITYLRDLEVVHDPLPREGAFAEDPSHAVILHLPLAGSEFAALAGDMLVERISRLHPAV